MKENLSHENSGMVDAPASDVYEIRPRREGNGFDLISDQLRDGPIPYAGPDAVRNAIAYAKNWSWSRSRRAIIRVLGHSEAIIEDFKGLGRHAASDLAVVFIASNAGLSFCGHCNKTSGP
jgi:hypothetical protein